MGLMALKLLTFVGTRPASVLLQLVREQGLELLDLRAHHGHAIALIGVIGKIILMVILRRIKDGCLDNFSHYWIDQFFGEVFLPGNRGLLLFLAQIIARSRGLLQPV